MRIELDLSASAPQPALTDAWDFATFMVVIRGHGARADVCRGTTPPTWSWCDDKHLAIPVEAVRSLAGEASRTAEWDDGFAKMVAYAESNGWIVDGGIRAHVEWQTD